MVSESAEMMLKHIHSLSAAGDRVRTTDLAQQTGLTPATVTEMVQRLGSEGFLDYQPYHGVLLTNDGLQVAAEMEHRFDLLQRFLVKVLGVEQGEADTVACRMEHILTRDIETRLCNLLGISPDDPEAAVCQELNRDCEGCAHPAVTPLSRLGAGDEARVRAILDSADMTLSLASAGLKPGATVKVVATSDGGWSLATPQGELSVDKKLAQRIILDR